MLRALHIIFFFILISCSSITKKPIIDYYPNPEIRSISNASVKRVVFLYKNKEISQNSFDNLMKNKKGFTFQVIKDCSTIEKIGYDPSKINGIILVKKIKNLYNSYPSK